MQTVASNFQNALSFTLDHEGRVCEDVPGDPGGKTKWGITQDDYNDYRKQHSLPSADVFHATEDELTAIYKEHYWSPLFCDTLPLQASLPAFDSAVNVGVSRVVGWIRAILGIKPSDPWLMAAHTYIDKHGAKAFADAIITRRNAYYKALVARQPALDKFLKGWMARTDDLSKIVEVSV